MNKKIYPWLPIIGMLLIFTARADETGLDDTFTYFVSGLWQVASGCITFYLITEYLL